METRGTRRPDAGVVVDRNGELPDSQEEPTPDEPPRRVWSDPVLAALTLLLGLIESTSGLGWPWLRLIAAVIIAWLLTQRRRAPLAVLVAVLAVDLLANVVLRASGDPVLVSGLMSTVAIYALARWAHGRDLVVGLSVVAGHMVAGFFVNPNWSAVGSLLFHVTPVLLALAVRPRSDRPVTTGDVEDPDQMSPSHRRPSRAVRVAGVVVVTGGLLAWSGGGFLVDQLHSYVTRTRSPAMPDDWFVDAATLRRAAELSRGTHGPDGAIIHTVDYPHELLSALEASTRSVEADVTVIDGEGFLQHDPKDPVGIPLLEFLEYAAIAEFPIVKLDLKRDRVDDVLDDVRVAVKQFGLDPTRVHFNADVFRGPGVDENLLGARTDLSFIDAMYNLVVMELETSDLVRVAEAFPESTVVISATPPRGRLDGAYSVRHLERYLLAAEEIRAVNPSQSLVFAVRGDLAARSDPFFLDGLVAVDDSYVAAWWAQGVPPTDAEVAGLRAAGVTFFDLGHDGVE